MSISLVTTRLLWWLSSVAVVCSLLPPVAAWAASTQDATLFEVTPLVLPAEADVEPNFNIYTTHVDHSGGLYFYSRRTDGSARGVYRWADGQVEPFLIMGSEVPVLTREGISTTVTIDNVASHFVDANGHVYFLNQSFSEPGGLIQLLRLEMDGGFTLLDSASPYQGLEEKNYPSEVLSDGRWLRRVEQQVEGRWVLGHDITDGASTQSLFRRAIQITTCVDSVEKVDSLVEFDTNAQGQTVLHMSRSVEDHERSDCTGPLEASAITQTLELPNGTTLVDVTTSSLVCEDTYTYIQPGSFKLNDAGQILYALVVASCDFDTRIYQLYRGNVLIHTLTIEEDPDELVESSFADAQLLPDGSVVYTIPAGVDPAHEAGGLFVDGELILRGDDPMFSEPVHLRRIGLANSQGAMVVQWQSVNLNDVLQGAQSATSQSTAQLSFGAILVTKPQPRWSNPGGGNWGEATNWIGEEVPGLADRPLFNLPNVYTVNTGNQAVASVDVYQGEVRWSAGEVDITGGLSVANLPGQATTLLWVNNRVQAGQLTIGAVANPEAEAQSTVLVESTGTLTVSGELVVGQSAFGGLGIFGQLATGNARLGVGDGASVFMINGQWTTGNLSVGESYPASVRNQFGLIQSQTARIGNGVLSPDFVPTPTSGKVSKVIIQFIVPDNEPDDEPTRWLIAQNLEIGNGHAGQLEILEGGVVQVGGSVLVENVSPNTPQDVVTSVRVSGVDEQSERASRWQIDNDLLVGNTQEGFAEIRVNAGGQVDVEGTFSLGHQPQADPLMIVEDGGSIVTAAQAAGATCTVGFGGEGSLIVRNAGGFECGGTFFVGLGDGEALLQIAGATTQVWAKQLQVGAPAASEPTGSGVLELKNNGEVLMELPSTVWENGTVKGAGKIVGDLTILGTLEVGLIDLGDNQALVSTTAQSMEAQNMEAGVLTVEGALTLEAGSKVQVVLLGADEYSQVNVSGTAQLDGTLTLAFGNGYAPRQGDTFQFVNAGTSSGSFAEVVVTGLAEGWAYTLDSSGGVTTLTAVNDGIATTVPVQSENYLPTLKR